MKPKFARVVEHVKKLLDIFRHLNMRLGGLVAENGAWDFGILFFIIFCKPRLVVTPAARCP